MAFVVVQFGEEEGGTIGIVRKDWLTPRKSEVYWPPYKKQVAFDKAIIKGESVNDSWELFKIKRCFGAFDEYTEAKRKSKIAEETSDLQSDAEERYVLKKRKVYRPSRYSESDIEEDTQTGNVPRPPKITTEIIQANENCIHEQIPNFSLDSLSDNITTPSSSRSATPGSSSSSQPASSGATPTLLENVLTDRLLTCLSTVIEQNKEILAILKNRSSNALIEVEPKIPVKLPLESFEDLDLIEEYLKTRENEQLLCSYLATLDKTSLVSSTNSILRHCLSYKLAKEFSFLGTRHNKKAFMNYGLKKVIVAAVKASIPSAVERNIEDQIKNWLKRSPKNYALEMVKLQKQIEDGVQSVCGKKAVLSKD